MIKIRLKDLLKEHGYTQKEFAEVTGLRTATISELCNNSRTAINKEHLATIMNTLKINDFNIILSFE